MSNFMPVFIRTVVFTLTLLLLMGCSVIKPTYPISPHLLLGNPSQANVDSPNNYLLLKKQYVLSYNRSQGRSNWASWQLNKSWLGSVERQNNFRPDETLPPKWEKITPIIYVGSGYDKGHLVPAADRSQSIEDNSATFLMTNMIPQAPDNNRYTWEGLEQYARDLVRKENKELYIIAGPLGSQGRVLKGKVVIPASTWKLITVLDRPGEGINNITAQTRTIAVNIPNKQGIDHDWRKYRITVHQLEKITGYHFLANIPGAIHDKIAANTETK
jgi:endonuclease G